MSAKVRYYDSVALSAINIDSSQGYFTAAMVHLDDVLSRHDLLTVQALALTTMYSFRAEVSLAIKPKPGTGIDADS